MSELPLLVQERGYLAIDKPPGTLVIPGRNERAEPSLQERLEAQLQRKLFTVHRLDRDTSGVLLFALDAATHRTLSMAFEAGQVGKRYVALVANSLSEPLDIHVAIAAARRGLMRPVRPGEQGKPSRTLVRPRETFARATFVEAEPLTGRTHQIRVHLLSAGYPLLVDPQYRRPSELTAAELGSTGDEVLLRRTPLHCAMLTLPNLPNVSARTVEAPLPADMARTLEVLRLRA